MQALLQNTNKKDLLTPIEMPARGLFYNYNHWFLARPDKGKKVLNDRYGEGTWESFFAIFDTFAHRATFPLQYVFADHYLLDIFTVDKATRNKLDRLWLTVLIDAYTRCILGAVFLRESHATRKITGKGICFLGMHYTSDTLSEQEMQSAVRRTADIEYLLSSFQSEEQDDIARQVGFQFAILRRKKGLSTQQVADQLAIPLHDIYSIEQGGTRQSTYFVEYLKYVEYLGGSLQNMFKQCLAVDESSLEDTPEERLLNELPMDPASQLYEDILFEHVQETIQILTALEEPITPTAIGRFMRASSKRLKQSSVFSAHWEQMLSHSHSKTARSRQQRGSELVEEVQRAAAILRTFGLSPTRELIGLIIGVSPTTFWNKILQHTRSASMLDYLFIN